MKSAPPPSSPGEIPEIARLAIKYNILSEEQVLTVLKEISDQNNQGRHITFEDYIQEHNLVSENTLGRLLAATVRSMDKTLGSLAIRLGILEKEQVDRALAAQKMAFQQGTLMPICDILMKWNHMTAQQRDELMQAFTSGIPSSIESDAVKESPSQLGEKDPQVSHDHPDEAETKQEHQVTSPLIDIDDQGLKVTLIIEEGTDTPLTLESVRGLMVQYDINYGMVEDAQLTRQLEKAGTGPAVILLAQGLAPVPGKPGTITLNFNNDYLNPGKITENGTIDFRERGEVPFVSDGALIAVKTLVVKGEPGIDVFGQTLPVEEFEDVSFKAGAGTRLSEDGLSIYATTEGQPFMTVHGEVCVFKELHINGDVDYSTGNISFEGNIFVNGSVKEGFSVKGGNLTAKEAQGATLDIKGNINVAIGIIDSFLTLGGSLQAMYMTGSKVDTYGDVMIKKEIIDSKIRASGELKGEQLNLISSFVSAKQGIDVKRIGTDVAKPCTLRIGISDHTNKIIKNFKFGIENTKKKLEEKQAETDKLKAKLKKSQEKIIENAVTHDKLAMQKPLIYDKIQELSNDPESSGNVQKLKTLLSMTETKIKETDDSDLTLFKEQSEMTDTILSFQEECIRLIREIEDLNTGIETVKNWNKKTNRRPKIRVSKEIHAQTSIAGPNTTMILKDVHKNVTIREVRKTDATKPFWDLVIDPN